MRLCDDQRDIQTRHSFPHFLYFTLLLFIRFHEIFPGFGPVLPILNSSQRRIFTARTKPVVKGQILQLFACDLRHFLGPIPCSPSNQLDGWVCSPHQLRKSESLSGSGLSVNRILSVGSFIADLPEFHIIRFLMTMFYSGLIGGVVAVIHPFGSFFCISRAHIAFGRKRPIFSEIRFEIDTDQGFHPSFPAKINKLMCAHLVVVNSSPQLIDHRLSLVHRSDTFFPTVIGNKAASPPQHGRGQLFGYINDILTPAIMIKIPCRIDRAIRSSQRLHKLHVQIGRDFKLGCRIDFQELFPRLIFLGI